MKLNAIAKNVPNSEGALSVSFDIFFNLPGLNEPLHLFYEMNDDGIGDSEAMEDFRERKIALDEVCKSATRSKVEGNTTWYYF